VVPLHFRGVNGDSVISSTSVHDLGIYIDSDASVRTHVSKTMDTYFAVLRQIHNILQSLVTSLVLTQLDYGNATLAGLPSSQLNSMNAAARLVFSARKSGHITPLLRDLHWLRVPQRIEFKLAVLSFHCLHSMTPL